MKIGFSFLLTLLFVFQFQAQDKPAYRLYNSKGKRVSYKKMIKKLAKTDVVLFGEYHDNPIVHWLQLEVTKDLAKKRPLVLGFEMIESDNQKALDEYLMGAIDQKAFDSLARLWKNYKTDYKPLVDFAKNNRLQSIATNIPRHYASRVFKKGGFSALDSLSEKEKEWIAPLPVPYDASLPGYKKMQKMMGEHSSENLPKAQAIKDATMAHFILKNRKGQQLFVHYNGAYHSDNFEGIYWYLKKYKPELHILTITTVSEKEVKKFNKEHSKKADFIIQVAEDMTKTF